MERYEQTEAFANSLESEEKYETAVSGNYIFGTFFNFRFLGLLFGLLGKMWSFEPVCL